MFQFYKKYMRGYFTIATPLNTLLVKKATLHWTEFETLRKRFKNASYMQYPDDDGVFTLEIDASTQALGYNLYKYRPTG